MPLQINFINKLSSIIKSTHLMDVIFQILISDSQRNSKLLAEQEQEDETIPPVTSE
jgi:hypothetical protein